MPKATNTDGSLAYLNYSQSGGGVAMIITPCGNICLKIVPEITDSKGASYTPDSRPGGSNPLLSFAHSEARNINTDLHFMITKFEDIEENLKNLRIIQSLVLPGGSSAAAPYTPPPVVRFIFGTLMDGPAGLCLVLKNWSYRVDPQVALDVTTFLPYKFTISCSWEVVYACRDLPTNRCIANDIFFDNEPPQTLVKDGFYYSKTVGNG